MEKEFYLEDDNLYLGTLSLYNKPISVFPKNNQVINTSVPTFEWEPIAGVTSYHIVIFVSLPNNSNSENIFEIRDLTTTSLAFNPDMARDCLKEGYEYEWYIIAYKDDIEISQSSFNLTVNLE